MQQQDGWPRSDGKAEKRGHASEAGRKKRRPRRGDAGLARRRSFHLILADGGYIWGGIRQGRAGEGLMVCPRWRRETGLVPAEILHAVVAREERDG